MVEPVGAQPGELLSGKYRLERVLGEGGMGVVMLARHVELEQPVAVKIIHPAAGPHAEAVRRLLREARAAAQLRSEHVVRVLDVGTSGAGLPYIVMEYLEGQDLAKLLEGGPLPVAVAVDYVLQACDAIAVAHEAGIVHRDLKPGNLFLASVGRGRQIIKVFDFGIAKVTSAVEGSLTRSSEIMGSPAYMSPEQLRSTRDVDGRSDIWSLGVILWQLVTGVLPFAGETFSDLAIRIAVDPLPPLPRIEGLPRELEAVLARALEKDPARRYQTVADLARALAPFAVAPSRAARPWRRRLVGAGVALALAGGGTMLALRRGGAPERDAGPTAVDAARVAVAPDAAPRGAAPPDAAAPDAASPGGGDRTGRRERQRLAEEQRRRLEEEQQRRRLEEEQQRRRLEEEQRLRVEEEQRLRVEEEQRRRLEEEQRLREEEERRRIEERRMLEEERRRHVPEEPGPPPEPLPPPREVP